MPKEIEVWQNFYRVWGAKGTIALAWWTGSFFAQQIRTVHSSYPFIEITGEPATGKTTLINFLGKLSGHSNIEGFHANRSLSKNFYRTFNHVSNLPIVLIESDRYTKKNNEFLWDELKDAFDGGYICANGLKIGSYQTYEPPFRGAVMIVQNTPIEASDEILTSMLHLSFDCQGHTLETKRMVDELDSIPREQACTYIIYCLRKEASILETYNRRLGALRTQYHDLGITHTRIALCHAQIAAMIEAVAKHVFNGFLDMDKVEEAQTMLIDMAKEQALRHTKQRITSRQFNF